jgi:hypothetical protein
MQDTEEREGDIRSHSPDSSFISLKQRCINLWMEFQEDDMPIRGQYLYSNMIKIMKQTIKTLLQSGMMKNHFPSINLCVHKMIFSMRAFSHYLLMIGIKHK